MAVASFSDLIVGTSPFTVTNEWTNYSGTATQDFRFTWDSSTSADNYTGNTEQGRWILPNNGSVNIEFGSTIVIPEMSPMALKRAGKLLRGMLTSKQRKMYDRFGFFDVRSPSQKHVAYRIPKSGLIVMYEHGIAKKRLCVYEKEGLPKSDWLVAAKMLCEADEKDLMKVANHHPLTAHRPVDPRVDRVPLILRAAA